MACSIVDDEKLNEIIEEKVEEQVEEEVEKKVKEKIANQAKPNKNTTDKLSRRDFLKKIGTGAAGLGALAMIPGSSAFNIRTSNPLNYYGNNQNNPNFSVQPDGTLQTQSISTDNLDIGASDFVAEGEPVFSPSWGPIAQQTFSTTSQSYDNTASWWRYQIRWDDLFPSGDITLYVAVQRFATMDVRLINTIDNAVVFEDTESSANISEAISFSPSSPELVRTYEWQIRSPDGSSVEASTPYLTAGIQL